jgi:hypothetical protein
MAFQSEASAQERSEPLPALPTPTQLAETKGIAESIAGPKAADPRKAGPAKGRAKTANARSKQPRAAAAKLKGPKVKGSKRKRQTGH